MKAKFIGVPGEQHDEITMYGLTFRAGRDVDVSRLSPTMQRKLKSHPHFKTTGEEAEDIAYREPGDAEDLAAVQGDADIAEALLQGKEPAPNAKEGLHPAAKRAYVKKGR